MKVKENNTRRNLIKGLGLGTMAGMLGMYPKAMAAPEKEKPAYLSNRPSSKWIKPNRNKSRNLRTRSLRTRLRHLYPKGLCSNNRHRKIP